MNNVSLDTMLKEELKNNKNAAKNLKKHWKEIQNIKNIDFKDVYINFNMQHIFRCFKGTNISLLAIFAVFEFLHNLNTFIDNVNSERKTKAINEAAGMEICKLGRSRTAMGFSKEENSRPFMIEHYMNRINWLKNGNIDVRLEVWNYILGRKNISDTEKKLIEKQAADEALNILKEPYNILKFIENAIDGNVSFQ